MGKSDRLLDVIENQNVMIGPLRFEWEQGKSRFVLVSLASDNFDCFSPPYYLNLKNGDDEGNHRVSSAIVKLDGVELFEPMILTSK